jgi:hypothetical protein
MLSSEFSGPNWNSQGDILASHTADRVSTLSAFDVQGIRFLTREATNMKCEVRVDVKINAHNVYSSPKQKHESEFGCKISRTSPRVDFACCGAASRRFK